MKTKHETTESADDLPGVGTLWHSKADRDGAQGLFVVRHVSELVIGRGRDVDYQVRLDRDDGAIFDVPLAVLFDDFAPHGAGAPTAVHAKKLQERGK